MVYVECHVKTIVRHARVKTRRLDKRLLQQSKQVEDDLDQIGSNEGSEK